MKKISLMLLVVFAAIICAPASNSRLPVCNATSLTKTMEYAINQNNVTDEVKSYCGRYRIIDGAGKGSEVKITVDQKEGFVARFVTVASTQEMIAAGWKSGDEFFSQGWYDQGNRSYGHVMALAWNGEPQHEMIPGTGLMVRDFKEVLVRPVKDEPGTFGLVMRNKSNELQLLAVLKNVTAPNLLLD